MIDWIVTPESPGEGVVTGISTTTRNDRSRWSGTVLGATEMSWLSLVHFGSSEDVLSGHADRVADRARVAAEVSCPFGQER